MDVVSRFAVPVGVVRWRDGGGNTSPFVKLTYDLGNAGWATLSAEQVPITEGDVESGRVLRPSDFAEAKGACEIGVVGRSLVEPTGAVRVRVGAFVIEAPRGALLGPVAVGGGRTYFASEAHRIAFPGLPLEIVVEGFGETLRSLVPAPLVDLAVVVDGAWSHWQRSRVFVDAILIEPRKRRCSIVYRGFSSLGNLGRPATLVVDPLGRLDQTPPGEVARWHRLVAAEPSPGHGDDAGDEAPESKTPPFGRPATPDMSRTQAMDPSMTLPVTSSAQRAQPLPFSRKPATSGAPPRGPASSRAVAHGMTQPMPAQPTPTDQRGTLPFIAPPVRASTPPLVPAPVASSLVVSAPVPAAVPPAVSAALPPAAVPPAPSAVPPASSAVPPVGAPAAIASSATLETSSTAAPVLATPPAAMRKRVDSSPPGAGGTTQLINLRALEESRAALPFAKRGEGGPRAGDERGTRLDPVEAAGLASPSALPFVASRPDAPEPSPTKPAVAVRRGNFDDDEHTAQVLLRPAPSALPFDATASSRAAQATPVAPDEDDDRGDTLPPPAPAVAEAPGWVGPTGAALPPPPAFAVALSAMPGDAPRLAPPVAQPVFRAQLVEPAAAPERLTDKIPALSLDEYAKLRAEIWSGDRPRREVLREHGLSELRWRAIERKWAARIDEASADPQRLLPMLARFQSYAVRIE